MSNETTTTTTTTNANAVELSSHIDFAFSPLEAENRFRLDEGLKVSVAPDATRHYEEKPEEDREAQFSLTGRTESGELVFLNARKSSEAAAYEMLSNLRAIGPHVLTVGIRPGHHGWLTEFVPQDREHGREKRTPSFDLRHGSVMILARYAPMKAKSEGDLETFIS